MPVPTPRPRCELPTLEVGERRVVRCHEPGARARLDRHVADGHPAFHRQSADRRSPVLDDRTDAARGAEAVDDREHDVFRGHAGHELAFHRDGQGGRPRLWKRLRGEHVLDLTRADADGERAERAVRRRVAVAAHDRHPRLREALLGPDHVHDPLARLAHRVQPDTELLAIVCQHLHLLRGDRVAHGQADVGGRHVVVHRGDRQVGAAHGAAGHPEPVERLGRRDLVHQVQVDVQEVGLAVGAVDDVALPDLLRQCQGHASILPAAADAGRNECLRNSVWAMDDEFDVVIEIPRGSRNKYEYDHEQHVIRLDRRLFSATVYPADYGFVPDTLAGDGDPLDVLVLLEDPTFPGCHVRVRAIGVFWMEDEQGPDAKILCVPAHDPAYDDVSELTQLRPALLDEIEHFFDVYKMLEPGKASATRGYEGREAALREIAASRARAADAT